MCGNYLVQTYCAPSRKTWQLELDTLDWECFKWKQTCNQLVALLDSAESSFFLADKNQKRKPHKMGSQDEKP
jgi:hypothetical protein